MSDDDIPKIGKAACGNCFYGHRVGETLICRRNPPIPIFMGVRQGSLGRQEPIISSNFAPVNPDIWCGEHRFPVALRKAN